MPEDLDILLQQLADDSRPVRAINLSILSDLPRELAGKIYANVSRLAPPRRLELVNSMAEQAEANVHFNFHAFLRECLADTEAAVRKTAIDGLWEDERLNLMTPLIRLVAEDPAAEVRAAAATSLGRFMLLGVLGEISDSYAARVAQALRTAWFRPGEVVEVRRRALEGLAYTDDAGVDGFIEAAYYDEAAAMRQSALFAMGRSANRRWARTILTELGSLDAAMRYEAVGAAGELGLPAAVKPLIRRLDDPDSTVREAAALALGKIGGTEARRALEACIESADSGLVEAATEALEELIFNSDNLDAPLLEYNPSKGRPAPTDDDAEEDEFDSGFDGDDFEEDDAYDDDNFDVAYAGESASDDFDDDDFDDDDTDDDDDFSDDDADGDDFDDEPPDEIEWRQRRRS